MTKIESIEGWRDNSFLKTMHDKARRGFPLTDRMQEGIEKFLLNELAEAPVVTDHASLITFVEDRPSYNFV